jgi:Fe2+ or Zn2+ uptake regulation protein
MRERLRQKGLRLTPQRLELLKILDERGKGHPSFSEVYHEMRKKLPSVSQSTILKNMTLFEEMGIVQSFSFKGETHYELNLSPHVNFVDDKGKIVDIEGEEIEDLLNHLVSLVKKQTSGSIEKLIVIIE